MVSWQLWGAPAQPQSRAAQPRSGQPDSRQLLLWGTLLICPLWLVQTAGVAASEDSSGKGQSFLGAFWGWTFPGKASFRVTPDHWADVALWTRLAGVAKTASVVIA